MKPSRVVTPLVIALLASGCAFTYHWEQAGVSEQQFLRDEYECALPAENMRIPSGWTIGDRARALYERRMRAKGYKQAREGGFTATFEPPAF